MRNIKFRGQTTDTKEWVEGDLIHGVGAKNGLLYILPNIVNFAYVKTKARPHHLDGYEVIPETVGQFTGLHDKNGKEIYESDYLPVTIEHTDPSVSSVTVIGIVEFVFGQFCVKFTMPESDEILFAPLQDFLRNGDKEILGNIFDNPELLK